MHQDAGEKHNAKIISIKNRLLLLKFVRSAVTSLEDVKKKKGNKAPDSLIQLVHPLLPLSFIHNVHPTIHMDAM